MNFNLALNNLPQVLAVPSGVIGSQVAILSFDGYPSAGTVTLEYKLAGSSSWETILSGASVVGSQVNFYFEGEISLLRLTFSGLVGGSGAQLWVTSRQMVLPPFDLLTDGGYGENRRIRVDVGQTGFFAGREFRTFKEWDAATTATYVIRANVPVNVILFELNVSLEEGAARVETVVGGSQGGTFSETLPIFATNNMSEKPQPPYANQVGLTAGGTHSGGTVLDVLRVKTSGNSNFASSVGASAAERGVSVNVYYFRITLTGAIGTFKARWEERP